MPVLLDEIVHDTPGSYSDDAPADTATVTIILEGASGGEGPNNTGGVGRRLTWNDIPCAEGDTISSVVGEAGEPGIELFAGSGGTGYQTGGTGGPPGLSDTGGGVPYGGGGGGGSSWVEFTPAGLEAEAAAGGGAGGGGPDSSGRGSGVAADEPGGPTSGTYSGAPGTGYHGCRGDYIFAGDGAKHVAVDGLHSGGNGSGATGGIGETATNPPYGTPTGGAGGGGGGAGGSGGGGGGGGVGGLFHRNGGGGGSGQSSWTVDPDVNGLAPSGDGSITIRFYSSDEEPPPPPASGSDQWLTGSIGFIAPASFSCGAAQYSFSYVGTGGVIQLAYVSGDSGGQWHLAEDGLSIIVDYSGDNPSFSQWFGYLLNCDTWTDDSGMFVEYLSVKVNGDEVANAYSIDGSAANSSFPEAGDVITLEAVGFLDTRTISGTLDITGCIDPPN